MKTLNKTSRTILATLVAGAALLTAGSAFAQADRLVISAPGPVATYDQPRMIPVSWDWLTRIADARAFTVGPARSWARTAISTA